MTTTIAFVPTLASSSLDTLAGIQGGGDSNKLATTDILYQLYNGTTVPAQTGNSGKFLTTNGTACSWGTPTSGSGDASTNTSTSVVGEISLFADTSGKLIKRATGTGLTKIASGVLSTASAGTDYYAPGNTVAIADGGTGGTTAQMACKNLGTWFTLAHSAAAQTCGANTTEDTLATVTIPANAMGANGMVRITTAWEMTNNANAKTPRIRFGGTSGAQYLNPSDTSTGYGQSVTTIHNTGATNAQISGWLSSSHVSYTASNTAPPTSAVDTTAAVDIVFSGQKAVSGDTLTLRYYLVELYYGA